MLVAGGYSNSGLLTSAEVYNPAIGSWTATGSLNTARDSHTATLLPNGHVLVAGCENSSGGSSSTELYDVGLGFTNSWQPQIATVSPLPSGGCLTLTGSRFRGIAEGSCGDTQDSPADFPMVQLHRLDNEQTLSLPTTSWSTNSLTCAAVTNFPSGYALATVFVNGIPSTARVLYVGPIMLGNPTKLSGGAMQFTFANTPRSGFHGAGHDESGVAAEQLDSSGQRYGSFARPVQFTDMQASACPQRFYGVRSP